MAHIVMTLIGDIRYDGRVRKEIRTLLMAGHEVELVVSDFRKSGAGGEDLGVRLHYIPMTFWPNPAMNFVEQLSFNLKAASIIERRGSTHVHCHDLSTLLAGVWSKRKIKAKLIFDAHELMPESMGGVKEKIWGYIERKSIKNCDSIIMPEKNRIAYFRKKYPLAPKIYLLENFPSMNEIPNGKKDLFREKYPIEKKQKIILYTGLIASRRHVEDLIHAMNLCGDKFVLIILGNSFKGYDKFLLGLIDKFQLTGNVFILGPVPHTEILKYMSSCDIGIALYRNDNLNNYYCASNKLYEYIALGKPVITNNYPGLLDYIHTFRQGICLDEVTPESLAKAFVNAVDTASITPGIKKYYWESQQDVLMRLYEDDYEDVCKVGV
jgi:glycosyltransferase involved in cell wall biosynthesis